MDTEFGIRFGRDPSDPLPPLKVMESNELDDEVSVDTTNSDEKEQEEEVEEPEYFPLVLPEDKPLITDYLYLALEQMQPANLMNSDRVGCYKGRRVGFPGLACKHW